MLAKAESLAATKKYKEAEALVRAGDPANPARGRRLAGPGLQHARRLPPRRQSAQGGPDRLPAHGYALQQGQGRAPAGPALDRRAVPPAQAGRPRRRVRAAAQAGVSPQRVESRSRPPRSDDRRGDHRVSSSCGAPCFVSAQTVAPLVVGRRSRAFASLSMPLAGTSARPRGPAREPAGQDVESPCAGVPRSRAGASPPRPDPLPPARGDSRETSASGRTASRG